METVTQYRINLKEKILDVAMNKFLRNGVKSVKMDELSQSLGVSKRTMYEIFTDKEDLLYQCVLKKEKTMYARLETYEQSKAYDVIDILVEFYHMQVENFAATSGIFLDDLSKYPRLTAYIIKLHEQRVQKSIAFFERGIAEGYFRKDLDYHLIGRLGRATITYIMDNRMYEEYSLKTLFHNVISLFIRGFCTPKGIEAIDHKIVN